MFLLDPSSGVPLYVQLHQQFRQRIMSGQLRHGDQLPSVRDLSAELHINPLTVTKVYQMLERENLAETRRGIGTYVCARQPALAMDARRQQMRPAVDHVVSEALHMGFGEGDLVSLITERFRKLNRNPHAA